MVIDRLYALQQRAYTPAHAAPATHRELCHRQGRARPQGVGLISTPGRSTGSSVHGSRGAVVASVSLTMDRGSATCALFLLSEPARHPARCCRIPGHGRTNFAPAPTMRRRPLVLIHRQSAPGRTASLPADRDASPSCWRPPSFSRQDGRPRHLAPRMPRRATSEDTERTRSAQSRRPSGARRCFDVIRAQFPRSLQAALVRLHLVTAFPLFCQIWGHDQVFPLGSGAAPHYQSLLLLSSYIMTTIMCLGVMKVEPLVLPPLNSDLNDRFGKRLEGVDMDAVIAMGRAYVDESPRTFKALGDHLVGPRWPRCDQSLSDRAIRTGVPWSRCRHEDSAWGTSGTIRLHRRMAQ